MQTSFSIKSRQWSISLILEFNAGAKVFSSWNTRLMASALLELNQGKPVVCENESQNSSSFFIRLKRLESNWDKAIELGQSEQPEVVSQHQMAKTNTSRVKDLSDPHWSLYCGQTHWIGDLMWYPVDESLSKRKNHCWGPFYVVLSWYLPFRIGILAFAPTCPQINPTPIWACQVLCNLMKQCHGTSVQAFGTKI